MSGTDKEKPTEVSGGQGRVPGRGRPGWSWLGGFDEVESVIRTRQEHRGHVETLRREEGREVGIIALNFCVHFLCCLLVSPSSPRTAYPPFTWRLRETTLTVSDFYCNTTQR